MWRWKTWLFFILGERLGTTTKILKKWHIWWSSRVGDSASHQNLQLFSRESNQKILFGVITVTNRCKTSNSLCNLSTIYFIQSIYWKKVCCKQVQFWIYCNTKNMDSDHSIQVLNRRMDVTDLVLQTPEARKMAHLIGWMLINKIGEHMIPLGTAGLLQPGQSSIACVRYSRMFLALFLILYALPINRSQTPIRIYA